MKAQEVEDLDHTDEAQAEPESKQSAHGSCFVIKQQLLN